LHTFKILAAALVLFAICPCCSCLCANGYQPDSSGSCVPITSEMPEKTASPFMLHVTVFGDKDGWKSYQGSNGLEGWIVRLEQPAGTEIKTALTDHLGWLDFELERGKNDYTVTVAPKSGWKLEGVGELDTARLSQHIGFVDTDVTVSGTSVEFGPFVPDTSAAPTDLNLSFPNEVSHPLAIQIKVTENGKPVPNAKLKVHAFNMAGNDNKLADYFLASNCTNCFWSTKGDEKIASICEGYKTISSDNGGPLLGLTSNLGSSGSFEPNCPLKQMPLELLTDENGIVRLEFFLDLAKLGDQVPQKDKPLSIPIRVEYWSDNGEKKIAEEAKILGLDHVG
jgi:hypothetical protein